MFTRVKSNDGEKRTVYIDDVATPCFEGDTVAAVMLIDSAKPYRRTLISGSERAPFCMMGVCFDCLVEIDGIPNQQGCLRNVAPGMRIRRQLPLGLAATQNRSGVL
jgi:D-hydroxyproline dehydrogenase subunit gamma